MADFSTGLKLGDLSDFIAPSQACVVSLTGGKLDSVADGDALAAGSVQLNERPRPAAAAAATAAPPVPRGFQQTLLQPSATGGMVQQAVKISLNDCLACSGCVTSAETVLLQHQSADELLARLADPGVTVVVSVSPQSVAALAAAVGLAVADCALRLIAALRQLGARAVFDIAWSRDVALLETAAEFVRRFAASPWGREALARAVGVSGAGAVGAGPGAAEGQAAAEGMDVDSSSSSSGTERQQLQGKQQLRQQPAGAGAGPAEGGGALAPPGPLPMLASACPGWVCYAEKTHGSYILPHIATTKSPQAIMGTVVKCQWAPAHGLQPEAVYHCAIMPCYDKKLEAAREDFTLAPGGSTSTSTSTGGGLPETDCVLATTELWALLQQRGLADLAALPPSAFDQAFGGGAVAGGEGAQGAAAVTADGGAAAISGAVGGSGGYLEFTMRAAAAQLFGVALPPGRLALVPGRNSDLKEWALELGGVPVLRGASAYGFRNIQGLMRKVKMGKAEYDYVEVMACPSGCLNGGGQLRPPPGQTSAQLIEQLERLYHDQASLEERVPGDTPGVAALYERWVGGGPGSPRALALLHTQYHKREKTVTAALGDW